MAQHIRRAPESAIVWLRSVAIAGFAFLGLTSMNVHPGWLSATVALTVGALALVSVDLSIFATLAALSIPIVAAQPVVGMGMLVSCVLLIHYLGADGGQTFLVLALALTGARLGIEWAAIALAGYFLGAGEGALAAALACVALEAVGIALGKPGIGVTVSQGPAKALVDFSHAPANLLGSEWLRIAIGNMGTKTVDSVVSAVSHLNKPMVLAIQPALWAAGAALVGRLKTVAGRGKGLVPGLLAVFSGVALPATGSVVMRSILGLPSNQPAIGIAVAASLTVSIGAVAVWERYFHVAWLPANPSRITMAAEDADVDELLRLIATAEDKLASQHTSTGVVMITDMKSFSRMTEEDGSVATAKAIQRHRDLLIPIIERHGGHGKSTGGDGLVASFGSSGDALSAASEMQSVLAARNLAHSDEREICVRIGIASGEVVLDRGGRPFIGAALNLAARAMNLADGGQIFVTDAVASSADVGAVRLQSFGKFELKNIACPVEILEVLWSPSQTARDPGNVTQAER